MGPNDQNKLLVYAAVVASILIIAASVFIAVRNSPDNTGPAFLFQGQPEVLVTTGDLPVLGNPNAPITIIEFSDYQCPFCGFFAQEVLPRLKAEYIDTGQVKFFYRDYAFLDEKPGITGRESHWAAEAARCAAEQGKFWEYHDHLFRNQQGENEGNFSKEYLKLFAQEIIFDKGEFNNCLDSGRYVKEILDDIASAQDYGIKGTPSFFIGVGDQIYSDPEFLTEGYSRKQLFLLLDNGFFVSGTFPAEFFDDLIGRLLQEVKF
jgi:protein-disulfide isomerase